MRAESTPLELTGRGPHATIRMNRLKRPGLARGVLGKENVAVKD